LFCQKIFGFDCTATNFVKEYRQLLEESQANKEILKRENYRLQHRIDELEIILKQRNEIIDEFQQRVYTAQSVKLLK
jgi:putative hemolysin